MARSFQHEKPPARVNLFLEVDKGDAKEKLELPLRMLVLGDFTGRESDEDVEDREVIEVNSNNFEDVLRSQDLNLSYTVPNTLSGEGDIKVDLTLDSLKSFTPEEVAKQMPELSKLLAARNLLQDLRNRLISMGDFRRQLEEVIKDSSARQKLLEELSQVVKDAEPAAEATDAEAASDDDA